MLKATLTEYETFPEDTYDARFKSIEERDSDNGTYWRWTFEINVGGVAKEFGDNSSARFTTRSKSYQWVKAILGRKPEGELEFADLVGLPCRLIVGIHPEDDDRNVLEKILPASKSETSVSSIRDAVRATAPDEAPF